MNLLVVHEPLLNWGDAALPLFLIGGLALSVTIGTTFAWTQWRKHQSETTCDGCGAELPDITQPCPRCGTRKHAEA